MFVFAVNALGTAAAPIDFLDVADYKETPENCAFNLGSEPTPGCKLFPSFQHDDRDFEHHHRAARRFETSVENSRWRSVRKGRCFD